MCQITLNPSNNDDIRDIIRNIIEFINGIEACKENDQQINNFSISAFIILLYLYGTLNEFLSNGNNKTEKNTTFALDSLQNYGCN